MFHAKKDVSKVSRGASAGGLAFNQLFEKESSTYTYILGDKEKKVGLIIDPVDICAERDATIAAEMGLKLEYAVNTHVHADHVIGNHMLKKLVPGLKSAISESSKGKAEILLKPGSRLEFGSRYIEALPTPGHTLGCMSYLLDDRSMVFTGDALLIRGCGRTDFQEGNSATLYDSIHSQIFCLPHETIIFPGHDYKGRTRSTIGEEICYNPRLSKTKAEFMEIMANLNLPYPKQIDKALAVNFKCGLDDE